MQYLKNINNYSIIHNLRAFSTKYLQNFAVNLENYLDFQFISYANYCYEINIKAFSKCKYLKGVLSY